MAKESQKLGRVPEEYRAKREQVTKKVPEIPQVNKYSLASPKGFDEFLAALKPFSPHLPGKEQESLNQAMDSGIYQDQFPEYLKDLYKIVQPPGITLDEYLEQNDRWENSVIIERSWKEGRGRFVRVPREEDYDRIVQSRNTFIISPETQQKLREQTFAIGGMGVGSAVGYLLVLNGAKNFKVADGGNLEPHNLNRFIGGDVGKIGQKLAILWTQMAYEANPFIKVECKPQNVSLTGEDGSLRIDDFLSGATMGIEEVDNLKAKRDFRRHALAQNLPVLMVTDLARKGGRVAFAQYGNDHILRRFTPETLDLLQDAATDRIAKTKIAIDVFIGKRAPREHLEPIERSATELPFWPQSGISAFISAAGGVNTIIDYFEGRKVPRERKLNLWRTRRAKFYGRNELFSRNKDSSRS